MAETEQLAEALELVAQTNNRYVDLYDSAPVAFATVDASGVIREINRMGCSLLGSARPNLLGTSLGRVFSADETTRFRDYLAQCRLGEQGSIQLTVHRSRAEAVPVEIVGRRRPDRRESYLLSIFDLTERRSASAEVAALEAASRVARENSTAKDHFIAVLSHELRTPLTPLLAAVALLEREPPPAPEELKRLSDVLRRNLHAEARLIDDLLDVSRITHGKLTLRREPISLHTTVREALETLSPELKAKDLSITVQLDAERDTVSGDPFRLRQVFLNLINNAIKFTREGGIGVRSWNRDNLVAVEVSDTGLGIAAGELDRLFRPFEQGRVPPTAGGLGLGLAIAKAVIALHQGEITAASLGPGQGARFIVEMTTEETASPAIRVPVASNGERARARILLVEDNVDTAEALAAALATQGFEVQRASSAAAALASSLDGIDLVISDISLPDAQGWDLMKKLRARTPIKAIALSGYGGEEDLAASREAGFALHLTKPIEISALSEAIRRVMKS
jgi:PAS domain S-box-containing protein